MIIYLNDKEPHHTFMENKERRRLNARALRDQVGSKIFAELADLEPSQISNLLGPNPARNIGDPIARRIEAGFKKELGWLDEDHSNPGLPNVVYKFAMMYEEGDDTFKAYLTKWVEDTAYVVQRADKELGASIRKIKNK